MFTQATSLDFDKDGMATWLLQVHVIPSLHNEVTPLTFLFSRFLAFFSMIAMADAIGSPPSTSRLADPAVVALGCCCGCCWAELFLGGMVPLSLSLSQNQLSEGGREEGGREGGRGEGGRGEGGREGGGREGGREEGGREGGGREGGREGGGREVPVSEPAVCMRNGPSSCLTINVN